MTEHPNLAVMRRTLDAFQTGDMAALGQLFASDVVWRVPGKSILAGDYRGQEAVFGLFGRMMQLTGGMFGVESMDMFANDTGGVFVDRVTGQREGRHLDVQLVLYVTIRNGQIVQGQDFLHQEHLWDAFWG